MLKFPCLVGLIVSQLTDTAFATVASSRTLQSTVDLDTCTPGESNFNIQLVNMGSEETTDSRYVEAFAKAAERWQKVIVGDLQDFPAGAVNDWFMGFFPQPYNGAVDDVVIGYDISSTLDGPGGTLGRAGGVFIRQFQGRAQSTISGIMQFDRPDLDSLPIDDVKAIILHEMGHVLGLVGIGGACTSACDPNNPSQQGIYQCPAATAEYAALVPGSSLALENAGGMGTACGHWEEDSFRTPESSEVMTGFFEANLFQPLSLVTVGALDDIPGYEVDYCGADVWPADENTTKRFEIYRTQNDMDMGMMESIPPMMGMDEESGLPNPLGGSSAAFAPFVGCHIVAVAMANLILNLFA